MAKRELCFIDCRSLTTQASIVGVKQYVLNAQQVVTLSLLAATFIVYQ